MFVVKRSTSPQNCEMEGGASITVQERSLCTQCITNQTQNAGNRPMNVCRNNYFPITKTTGKIPLWSTLILLWTSLMAGFTEGLQCYECLSLQCESGAVCDAIKSTMVEIFVPKRHFIHFNPSDICPEEELPLNSTRWANLSRECERSDSLCLVSPIEVLTVVDGKKNGKKLEKEHPLTTYGYLRGCASRRKLLEFPETINVRIEFIGRNESNQIKGQSRGEGSTTGRPSSDQGSDKEGTTPTSKKKKEIFYNMTNIRPGAEFDPTKKKYEDGYTIMKIYSHVFYIDQGTQNATKCYEDNCNDKVKFSRRTSGASSMMGELSSGSISVVLLSISLKMLFM